MDMCTQESKKKGEVKERNNSGTTEFSIFFQEAVVCCFFQHKIHSYNYNLLRLKSYYFQFQPG